MFSISFKVRRLAQQSVSRTSSDLDHEFRLWRGSSSFGLVVTGA